MKTQPVTAYNLNSEIPHGSYNITIEPKNDTPYINFSESGFTVRGRSMKVDIHNFYEPFISRLSTMLENGKSIKLYFFFSEINASTTKVLFNLFKKVRATSSRGTRVDIFWGVEPTNDDMMDIGECFAQIYDLNIKYVTKN